MTHGNSIAKSDALGSNHSIRNSRSQCSGTVQVFTTEAAECISLSMNRTWRGSLVPHRTGWKSPHKTPHLLAGVYFVVTCDSMRAQIPEWPRDLNGVLRTVSTDLKTSGPVGACCFCVARPMRAGRHVIWRDYCSVFLMQWSGEIC